LEEIGVMPPDQRHVRVMTWNIHGALGRNRRYDLLRVVELIRGWQPDIVALQEVDSRRGVSSVGDPFQFLQRELGAHGIGAKSIQTADGEYGQMLISRWPLERMEVHDISWPEREPRRAIYAEVSAPSGSLRIVATHLGLSFRERSAQTRKLLELVDRGNIATVLLGDFNDWLWAGSVRRPLAEALPSRTRHRTFPSICPVLHLDRVYCRPQGVLANSFVDRTARSVSDHLAVIADVRPTAVSRPGPANVELPALEQR
jgi:endonuclease/exonuclease/phosphatase family metal-dependent hydrolase